MVALSIWPLVMLAVNLVVAGVEAWALVDAAIRPAGAFRAAGKATKTLWVALTAFALSIGVAGVIPGGFGGLGGIASIAAVVVAFVYLVDVRPAVRGGPRPPRRRPAGPAGGW